MNREEARKKAERLVAQMTLEEKASQLRYDAPAIPRLGIPACMVWQGRVRQLCFRRQSEWEPPLIQNL